MPLQKLSMEVIEASPKPTYLPRHREQGCMEAVSRAGEKYVSHQEDNSALPDTRILQDSPNLSSVQEFWKRKACDRMLGNRADTDTSKVLPTNTVTGAGLNFTL